jgi:hypothetical protein
MKSQLHTALKTNGRRAAATTSHFKHSPARQLTDKLHAFRCELTVKSVKRNEQTNRNIQQIIQRATELMLN